MQSTARRLEALAVYHAEEEETDGKDLRQIAADSGVGMSTFGKWFKN